MMIQPEIFQSSWSIYNTTHSDAIHPGPCSSTIDANDFQDFGSSGALFDSFISTIFSDEIMDFRTLESIIQTGSSTISTYSQESLEFEDVCKWSNEINKEGNALPHIIVESPCVSLESSIISEMFPDFPLNNSLEASEITEMFPDCPGNNTDEDDDQRSLCHMLMAYAEAMENGYLVLAEIIAKHIWEKINPIGKGCERVVFHLFKSLESSRDYLGDELSRNIEAAHKLIHQCSPYAWFAHFTANTAIREAIPDGTETVYIIDFDTGDGVQLALLIDAISHKNVALKLISIKLENEINHGPWKFQGTMKRLFSHAKSSGVKLKIEQINLDDLETELKRMKKRSKKTDWFAFNCMIGLPHMAKRRHRHQSMKFLSAAKVFLAEYVNHRGILTFGNGEAVDNPRTCSGYASFLDKHLRHYQALFESMESHFPVDLAEVTIAVESLFLAPYICAESWFQQWKNMHEWLDLRDGNILEDYKISMESIIEAKEMVNEAKSLYKVKVEGDKENEVILEFKGTALVRVSCWI